MLKFVVMSDLHIVPEGDVSAGLDTAGRFECAVKDINRHHADADFCVLAGDLADHGDAESYERLKELMKPLSVPTYITLGNHDDRNVYLDVFGRGEMAEDAFLNHAIDVKGYRVIVLDSSEPGVPGGVLCENRLDWLEARLAEAIGRPVIIVLHHHANDLHLPVDTIKLDRAEAFVDVVKTHPDVRQVIAGHVHLATSGYWQGIPFTTLAGGHYSVSVHLPGMSGAQARLEGPGQYAVVLADKESVLVHFHNFIDRHLVMAKALFGKKKSS
ncbi:MAG: phosphodiesterase [Pseudomonadota bacterium]